MSPDDPRHGTPRGHHAGCRLDCCREARNRYERNMRKRRELGHTHLVDATGSRRRVCALMRLGWPAGTIAEKAGIKRGQQGIDQLIRRSKQVQLRTAQQVAEVYEELSMNLGPSPITRARAERNGWPPPLAWDNIDDPNEKPRHNAPDPDPRYVIDEAVVQRVLDGEVLPTSRAERIEITRRWLAAGKPGKELSRRMGWQDGRYVERMEEAS